MTAPDRRARRVAADRRKAAHAADRPAPFAQWTLEWEDGRRSRILGDEGEALAAWVRCGGTLRDSAGKVVRGRRP